MARLYALVYACFIQPRRFYHNKASAEIRLLGNLLVGVVAGKAGNMPVRPNGGIKKCLGVARAVGQVAYIVIYFHSVYAVEIFVEMLQSCA